MFHGMSLSVIIQTSLFAHYILCEKSCPLENLVFLMNADSSNYRNHICAVKMVLKICERFSLSKKKIRFVVFLELPLLSNKKSLLTGKQTVLQ